MKIIEKIEKNLIQINEHKKNQNFVFHKKPYLLGYLISFVTMGLIFYYLYPEQLYLPSVSYVTLSTIFLFTVSHLVGTYIVDLQFQASSNIKYNSKYVLLEELLITLTPNILIAYFVYQSTFKRLVGTIDITVLGLLGIISLGLLVAYIYKIAKRSVSTIAMIERIILTTLFVQVLFYLAPNVLILDTLKFIIIVLLIVHTLKFFFKHKQIRNQKRYNWVKGSVLVLTVILTSVNLMFTPLIFWTKPIVDSTIQIDSNSLTNNYKEQMIIHGDYIYLHSLGYDSLEDVEKDYISIFDLDGKEKAVHSFTSDETTMFLFDDQVRIVVKMGDVIQQYNLADGINISNNSYSGICEEDETQLRLEIDYELSYVTDICLQDTFTDVVFRDQTSVVLVNEDNDVFTVSSDFISLYDNQYRYSNNSVLVTENNKLEIFSYMALNTNSDNSVFFDNSIELNGSSTLTLNDELMSKVFYDYKSSEIYDFYVDDNYFYLVTGADIQEMKYLSVYDLEGNFISSLGFESMVYTFYEENIYFLSDQPDRFEVYKINPLNSSEPALVQGFVLMEDLYVTSSGIGMPYSYNGTYQSSYIYALIVVSVLFVIPPIRIKHQ